MECERLVKLVKTWYLQVKDESLAPARMVAFMEKHLAECPVCMVDDGVRQEVDRITRIVLPPSKMQKPKQATEEEEEDREVEEEGGEEESESEDNEDIDSDEEDEIDEAGDDDFDDEEDDD